MHGGETLQKFIGWCAEDGVEMLTVFAFSIENWNREVDEVDTIMKLFLSSNDKLRWLPFPNVTL